MVIAPNCPNASRLVINDSDSERSCHLVMFDHSPELIEPVIYLQFACEHVGQFWQDDREIVACLWHILQFPAGSGFPRTLKSAEDFPVSLTVTWFPILHLPVIFQNENGEGL